MAGHCERCTVGMIGARQILSGEWANAIAEFEIVIAAWNEKTKHFAIPHPGFANKFCFCPKCGQRVEE